MRFPGVCLALVLAVQALTTGCAKMHSPRSARTVAVSEEASPPKPPALQAPVAPHDPVSPAAPSASEKSWMVTGYGRTAEDARDDAVRRAVNEVRDFLKERHPDLDRPLTPIYLTRSGMARVFGSAKELPRQNNQPAWEADVLVEMKPERLAALYDLARKDRMGPRHHTAMMLLFGICSFLAVAGVYLRLENATRGYSTGLLRVVALTLLAGIVGTVVVFW